MATYFFAMIGKVLAEFSMFYFCAVFLTHMETYILAISFLPSFGFISIKCLLAGIWVGLAFFSYVGPSYK